MSATDFEPARLAVAARGVDTKARACLGSAFEIRMMYQVYLERGFVAKQNDIETLMALLGHAPRTYEAFARDVG